ncbi:hypothetical protein ThidrDRAFT_3148 [Thiorhodococcus drewsii AZ1]|uniref:Inner membrane protein YgaP-like transmembrane domain-containing protein n=1 Tax=Thiorhodococcus drewsii AZ1 TaxID=765913 RepID=G2E4D5_9GAMM|nr:DUF2892 domain-containing protein [Thiorhodococcus drewsii]EGV29704.1 hypothetical protein ThidrDRAFT_3148 [Thiorhodococcus drewsii AZ1]
MNKNIGENDRKYRAIAGILFLLWGLSTGNAWGLIGFALLATAYLRWCPVYIPMDVDTTR